MKHLNDFKNFKNGKNVNENVNTPEKHEYNYLFLTKYPNGLEISLTEEGKQKVEEDGIDENNFYDYFEDIQGNSDYMYHFDMGEAGFGLTSAPGITDGYYISDDGKITDDGHDDSEVYWYPNYMVKSFADELKEEGKTFFTKSK